RVGGRRPDRVWRRSGRGGTSGGTVIASRPPIPRGTPIAVFCDRFGTTESIWFWIRTVVRGIQRKLLPNQKAPSPACRRLPKAASVGPPTAAAVTTAQG